MPSGYIYVLINKHMNGLVKIGRTTKDPKERARELSSHTGVPGKFELVYSCESADVQRDEREIHRRLMEYRVIDGQRREFFEVSQEKACNIIKQIIPVVQPSSPYKYGISTYTTYKSKGVISTICTYCHNKKYALSPDIYYCPNCMHSHYNKGDTTEDTTRYNEYRHRYHTPSPTYIQCPQCKRQITKQMDGRYWCYYCQRYVKALH